jgi:hypothetical protein
MSLQDLLSLSSTGWAGVVAVGGVLYTAIKTLLEFNDEYLQKRTFKRLAFLREQIKDDPHLSEFLTAAVHEEVFRAAYGMPIPARSIIALTKAYSSGLFSLAELKACALYTTVDDAGNLHIQPGKGGYAILVALLFFVFAMSAYVASLLFALLTVGTVPSVAGALAVLVFYFFFAWYFGRDIRAVLLARKASKKLNAGAGAGAGAGEA